MTDRPVALGGTLRWEPLRHLVAAGSLPARHGMLPFHRPIDVDEATGPSLGPGDGMPVDLVEPDPEALARLDFYTAVHGCSRGPAWLIDGVEVEVYVPLPAMFDRPDWSLEKWRLRHGDLALVAAVEIMDHLGAPPEDVAARMPGILRRAQARLRARGGLDRRADVTVESRERLHAGFYNLEAYELRHRLARGGLSETLRREVFQGYDAVIVLPWDPARRRVLLVEQFRIAPFARGDADPWTVEPVAGLIDVDESPEEAARRELMEEAGLEAGEMIAVGAAYPSPGNSTEWHHHFVAICDLPDGAAGLGGLASEGEDIAGRLVAEEALIADARAGRVDNTPLALLALWLALEAPALRARLAGDGGPS